jgi:transposase-like protein
MTSGAADEGTTTGNIKPLRAVPFYCPYCADEDLRPDHPASDQGAGAPLPHGQWRCGGCQRVFALKYLGTAASQRKATT